MAERSRTKVYFGATLFDGAALLRDRALVVEDGRVAGILSFADKPIRGEAVDLQGGILSPGFVDWQVNGGGGVLFNADPTPEGIAKIARAHRAYGATAILPTVITDTPDVLAAALKAAKAALVSVPGSLGVHVEGPFFDVARKGVHRADLIRPMHDSDVQQLIDAKAGAMVVTLAPNKVAVAHIARLAEAGIIVSLGHSDATSAEAHAAFDAGATAATHLFNAMSPLANRAPGLVGAALARKGVICGLIADGVHVHDDAMRVAIAAKGARGISFVSDAMPTAAGGGDTFFLQGREMFRAGDRLTDASGTLAGAVIVMHDAVVYAAGKLGVPVADALAMATATPARLLGLDDEVGTLKTGARADLVHLSEALDLLAVYDGVPSEA